MMHMKVFHFCLATNRQPVAQLCAWVETSETLTRISRFKPSCDSFPSPRCQKKEVKRVIGVWSKNVERVLFAYEH